MNWSVIVEVLLQIAVAATAVYAVTRAQMAEAAARSVMVDVECVEDRLGITPDDVEAWHRVNHPGCYDAEHGTEDGR